MPRALRWNRSLPPVLLLGLGLAVVAWSSPAMPAALADDALQGEGPSPQASPASLAPAWETAVQDTPAPFVSGTERGFVVATRAGRVTAWPIQQVSGAATPSWQVDLGAPVMAAPMAAAGALAVIVGSAAGHEVLVLDLDDGRTLSRLAETASAPYLSAIDSGILSADPTAGSASLTLLDPLDGAVRWKTPLASVPSAPAGRCGDLIVVGGGDGKLTAVSAADGSPRWTKSIGGAITTAPLCAGRRAWVGSSDNHVHALTLRRRGAHRRWSFLTGGDVTGGILLHGTRVLFSSFDTYLYSLEAENGHLAWKVHLGRRPQSQSVLLGDLLVVAPLNTERLEVFHLPEGTQTAALSLASGKDRFVTAPSAAGRSVVIGAARYGEETSRVIGVEPAAEAGPAAPGPTSPAGPAR